MRTAAMLAGAGSGRLWAVRPVATAVVVCPLLPEPPVTGGQKRTLRLLEAMERAGLRPHILTPDTGAAAGTETLRARGWGVDVVEDAPPTVGERLRQHLERRPSPLLHRLGEQVTRAGAGAAPGQGEHTQSAHYPAPPRGPRLLSLPKPHSPGPPRGPPPPPRG